jgi:hypothetical protein
MLFGAGKVLLNEVALGLAMIGVALVAGAIIYWDLSRRGWSSVVD